MHESFSMQRTAQDPACTGQRHRAILFGMGISLLEFVEGPAVLREYAERWQRRHAKNFLGKRARFAVTAVQNLDGQLLRLGCKAFRQQSDLVYDPVW